MGRGYGYRSASLRSSRCLAENNRASSYAVEAWLRLVSDDLRIDDLSSSLPTLVRSLPRLEALPVSSPSYPSSCATSQWAAQGYSDDAEPRRYHQPPLFSEILKPERYLPSDNEAIQKWSRVEQEAMAYEMEEQLIPGDNNAMRGNLFNLIETSNSRHASPSDASR